MALTPDTPDAPNEAFLREVDENLRRDQLESFAKHYAKWLIGGVILFLAAVGGYLYWSHEQQKQAAAQSEELMSIYTDIGNGNADKAKKRLEPLEKAGNDTVRALAMMTQAAIALEQGDRDGALTRYRTIAEGKGFPDAYRDLALLRTTAMEFDSLKPEQVISRLEPLAKPGNPWFGTAGELTAMAYLKQGQKDKAGQLFAAIAKDTGVPDTLRSRAVQIASTLGIDAGVDLPQLGQPGNQ